jgi:hypothetical protein
MKEMRGLEKGEDSLIEAICGVFILVSSCFLLRFLRVRAVRAASTIL